MPSFARIISKIRKSSPEEPTSTSDMQTTPPHPSTHPSHHSQHTTPPSSQPPPLSSTPPSSDKFTFLQTLTSAHRHRGKPFYTHLHNVYLTLQAHGCAEPVCDAGLYHSIYGTEFYRFEPKGVGSDGVSREVVRGLIGGEAEGLVWVFCGLRGRWEVIVGGGVRAGEGKNWDRKDGEVNGEEEEGKRKVVVGLESGEGKWEKGFWRDMCWIEWANLRDQNGDGRYDMQMRVLEERIEELSGVKLGE